MRLFFRARRRANGRSSSSGGRSARSSGRSGRSGLQGCRRARLPVARRAAAWRRSSGRSGRKFVQLVFWCRTPFSFLGLRLRKELRHHLSARRSRCFCRRCICICCDTNCRFRSCILCTSHGAAIDLRFVHRHIRRRLLCSFFQFLFFHFV